MQHQHHQTLLQDRQGAALRLIHLHELALLETRTPNGSDEAEKNAHPALM